MGRRTWKQACFLVTAFLTAVFFWNLERRSRVVNVPAVEESETASGESETAGNEESGGAEEQDIRVLILSDNFASQYQSSVQVLCLTDAVAQSGDVVTECPSGKCFLFSADDEQPVGGEITFRGSEGEGSFCLQGLKRGYENPVYEGSLTLRKTAEGYLVVNELPLERYLCKVVPSEMPASYPEEALKAQAVCARTYAMKQLEKPRLNTDIPADVDDSVNFQVYNNQPEEERCTRAVEETKGLLLTRDGTLLDALYYSTSCGIDLNRDLSQEAVFCSFLSIKNEKDYEKDEVWYRWNTYFSAEQLTDLTWKAGYETVGNVTGITLGEREESGCLKALTIEGSLGRQTVEGEYQIRKLLCPAGNDVTLQDGSTAPDLGMLPSAFFYLVPSYDGETLLGYRVIGGGYGHGVGLSQNGARNMAEDGMNFREILTYYYGEIELYEALDTGD